ncbi:universal stress protein [Flavobacteriaceae bacterium LMO-SS05]
MKKILVPTDFSNEAEYALKVAAQLSKTYGSEIYLLHLLELPMQEVDALNTYSELPSAMFFMELAHQKLEDLMTRDYLEGLNVHVTIKPDSALNGIIEKSKEHHIDMIIMGSHGASGLREVFIGSIAEKVVRFSDVPVMVIKKEHNNFHINTFVFGSDFKKESKRTYKQAIKIAQLFNAKIHLLMVNTANHFMTTTKANKRIQEFIKDIPFEDYTITIYNDLTIEAGILNFSNDVDADLIGISTHGRQGLLHFINGSIGEDIVNHANRPVITFKI